jgi:acyl-CoA hydrolase
MTTTAADAVEFVIEKVGRHLVIGTPLGIGKPIPFLDGIYERAKQDHQLKVEIITALTLSPPRPGSELEQRLLDPIAARMEGWQAPAYLDDLESGRLPPNVTISEFYLRPGGFVDVGDAQRWHINANYSDVVRDCLNRGINVVAQSVASDGDRLSLSSNPDVTLDLLAHMALDDRPTAMVGVINDDLPFVGGDATIDRSQIDVLVDGHRDGPAPFPVPSEPVSVADHAIGLQAAALIRDGGTIQLGIGSMADAVATALILRHRDPRTFQRALDRIGALDRHAEMIDRWGGTEPFQKGLYGCSEMLSDALFALYETGIVTRHAYPNEAVQRLADTGKLDPVLLPQTLHELRRSGIIGSPLGEEDLALLTSLGVIADGWRLEDETLQLPDGSRIPTDMDAQGVVEDLVAAAPHPHLNAPVMHAAFFLGSDRFYERLRKLSPTEPPQIEMTGVAFTNTLDRSSELRRAQRRDARFVNQAMKVAADGSSSAHVLESGKVLSGVGGHFDFVEMARKLPDGRSLTLINSTRRGESNVVPQLAHVTVPGPSTDLVVTEYGVADLQSKNAGEVLDELVSICDSRFQEDLISFGQATGRLPSGYRAPEEASHNTEERLQERLGPLRDEGVLPTYPMGTGLTDVEVDLVAALRSLDAIRKRQTRPGIDELRSVWSPPEEATPYLARMGLEETDGLKEKLLRRVLVGGLVAAGVIESR